MKRQPVILKIPGARGMPCHCGEVGGTEGGTRVGRRAEREGENVAKSLYCGFCGKKWARQAKLV